MNWLGQTELVGYPNKPVWGGALLSGNGVYSDTDGGTPLHEAAGQGDAAAINALLAGGADPNAQNKEGATPLHKAARYGHAAAINVLLAGGADPKARDKDGRIPFDLISADSPLVGTPAYWRLHEARWD